MRRYAYGCLLAVLAAAPAVAREWSDASGKNKFEGEFRTFKDGKVVIQMANGSMVQGPMEKFSADDQAYIKQLAGLAADAPKAAAPAAAPEAPQGNDRFSTMIKENPGDPRGYYLRGLATLNSNKPEEAMADFNKAIELNPKFADAYDGRGLAYQKMKKPAQAHEDFSKAIEANPEMASAYRHRADNMAALAKDKDGRQIFDEAAENYRKKYNHADKANISKTPWQPLNTTSGNVSPMVSMYKEDYERAVMLEGRYGGGGVGGDYGGYGGGVAYGGGPGVAVVGPGPGVVVQAPGPVTVGPPLQVLPQTVKQGEYVTLVANASELAKGMPQKGGTRRAYGRNAVNAKSPLETIESVDFYRDVDGDGRLNTGADKLLGNDGDGKDGFSIKVPTTEFPPGQTAFFAVPRGKVDGNDPKVQAMIDAGSLLEKAAAAEREVAAAAEQASKTNGLNSDETLKLDAKQEKANADAKEAYNKVRYASPEVAKILGDAAKSIKTSDSALGEAEKAPGEGSKAPLTESAVEAKSAADKLAEAASKLRALQEAAASAAGSGKAVAATGSIQPGEGSPAPADVAGGPGKPGDGEGKGGDGEGKGGYGGDDNGYAHRRGRDVAADNVAVENGIDYVRERDYDRAIEEFDRLVVRDPDNAYYLRNRANTYLETGSYDYAIRDYDRLVELDVKNADLYYNRGCAHLAAGHFDSALEDFTKSISLDETRNLAFTNRGTTYARKLQYEKAIEDFTKAIALKPDDRLAYRNRALAYKKMGDMKHYDLDMTKYNDLGGE